MVVIAVLLALLAGGAQGATLRGVVTDAKTTTPVADAQVAIVELARTTRTGADGRFEFRNLPAGKYTLTVSTIGYIFVRRPVRGGRGGHDRDGGAARGGNRHLPGERHRVGRDRDSAEPWRREPRWIWDRPGSPTCAASPLTIRSGRCRHCRASRRATTSTPSSPCAARRSVTSASSSTARRHRCCSTPSAAPTTAVRSR